MMPGNMYVFASRITLATAGVLVRISSASTRPVPSFFGINWWLMTPRNDSATINRTCGENQAILVSSEQLEMLRQAQFVHGSDMGIDHAKNNFNSEALPNHACAITSELVCIGKVGIAA